MNEIMKAKMVTITKLMKEIKLGKEYRENNLKITNGENGDDYLIYVLDKGHESIDKATEKELRKILKVVL